MWWRDRLQSKEKWVHADIDLSLDPTTLLDTKRWPFLWIHQNASINGPPLTLTNMNNSANNAINAAVQMLQ